MVIDGLREALDALERVDPRAIADEESALELHRLRARLDAAVAVVDAAYDASKTWMDHRARSAAEWIAYKTHEPVPSCQRSVRMGRALRHMPAAEAAWRAGEITGSHVNQLVKVWTPRLADVFERDEKLLVDDAKHLRFSSFLRVVERWVTHADPDRGEDKARKQLDARKAHLSQSFEGMWFGELVLDPISGAIVDKVLRGIGDDLFRDDWAEAAARLGHEPSVVDLRRTPAQRRADAFVEMATRASTAPADGRRPEPLFSVLVDYETLYGPVCELANRSTLTPAALLPWIDRAWVERAVFDAKGRIIDISVHQRLFTGAARRAIELRDQECFHPTCEEPAERCEIDHIEPYAYSRRTTQDNGRCACAFHNRQRQRRTGPPLS